MTNNGSEIEQREPRADARRNRARIFAAAKRCFAEQGAAARMEDIAKLAETGIGTLYRSFGNRAGLAEAIFREALDELVEIANAQSEEGNPRATLERWLTTYIDEIYAKRTMLGDLMPLFESEPDLLEGARANAVAALGAVLARAQEAGAVRADIDAGALMQLVNGLAAPAGSDPKQARLLLEVVLDGLAV
jgi:AcrR family transcriptional regulator